MGAMPRLGACLASLLAACGFGAGDAPQPASDAAPVATAEAATSVEAPTLEEVNRSCPLGAGVPFGQLRALVDSGDFAALDAEMQKMLDAHRATPACEHHLWNTFEFLQSLDFDLLDRWVAARPDSWAAFTARGARWVETGYRRRGAAYSKDVKPEQWAGMHEALDNADRDLTRALELEPDGFVAYGTRIYRLRAEGRTREALETLDALLARDPLDVGVRQKALDALSPYYGGSIEAMRTVADDAQRFADRNPRLRILPGFVEAEIARKHRIEGRWAEAVAGYRKALAHGEYGPWYYDMASCFAKANYWTPLLRLTDRWQEGLGDNADAHVWRGRALEGLERPAEALAEYDRAVALAPEYGYALNLRGRALRLAGRTAEAAADLRHGLEREVTTWAVDALIDVTIADPTTAAGSESIARQLAGTNPEDPRALFLLASVLHASGAVDARPALERYVAVAGRSGDEASRLAQAQRMLGPDSETGKLPALSRLRLKDS